MFDELIKALDEQIYHEGKRAKEYILHEFFLSIENNLLKVRKAQQVINGNYYGTLICLEDFIAQQVSACFSKLELSAFVDNPLCRTSISAHIYQYIINFHLSKLLLSESKIAMEHLLEEKDRNHEGFVNLVTNDKDWIYYFFKKYPVSYFLVSSFIEHQLTYVSEVATHLNADELSLKKQFEVKGKITTFELAKGDLHKQNRSVCKIHFTHEAVFYKPRSFAIDQLIKGILENSDTLLKIPNFLERAQYGYSENIQNVPNDTGASSTRTTAYFFELGKAMRLINDLQFEDIINDNVIYANGYLYLIDVESVMVPKIVWNTNHLAEVTMEEMHSPLSTGALPARQGAMEYCNSIALPSKIDAHGKLRELEGKNFFEHTFTRSIQDIHLPHFYSIASAEHYQKCCMEAEQGYGTVQHQYDGLPELIEQVDASETRVIFRETVKYFQLLMHCRAPEFMVSVDGYLRELAVVLPTTENDQYVLAVKNSEFEQLKEGDIPIFSVTKGALTDHLENVVISDYYELNQRASNINGLQLYGRFISEVLKYQLPDVDFFNDQFQSIRAANLLNEIHSIQNRVFKLLKDATCSFPKRNGLLTCYIDEEKMVNRDHFITNIAIMRPGLFDGLDGLLYSLQNWSERNGLSNYFESSFSALKRELVNLSKSCLLHPQEEKGSLFTPPFSGIISIVRDYQSGNTSNIDSYTRAFLEKLTDLIHEPSKFESSFYSGVSSSCLFVCNNESYFSSSGILENFYDSLTSSVSQLLADVSESSISNSASHWSISDELPGHLILLTILKRKSLATSELLEKRKWYMRKLGIVLETALENLDSQEHNQSWLKGINGLVAVALGTDPEYYKHQLKLYFNIRKENISYTSFSLSGGNIGSVMLLRAIASLFQFDAEEWLSAYTFESMFNLHNDHLVKSMLPKGLYNGICGVMELDQASSRNILVASEGWLKL